MTLKSYTYIITLIVLAVTECEFNIRNLPKDVNTFNELVMQYGRKSKVTEKEVNMVFENSISNWL